jgi:hypothetical protein
MPSVVYIVRSPLHALSPALLPGNDSTVIFVGAPSFSGMILRMATGLRSAESEHLSYAQLIEILLQSRKVIVL